MPYTGQRCSLSGIYKLLRGCVGQVLINMREAEQFPDYQGLPAEWALYKPSSVDAGRTDQRQGEDRDAYEQGKRAVERSREYLAASAKRIEEAKNFVAGIYPPQVAGEVSEAPNQ